MAGKTEAVQLRKGLSLYKQPGSPNWYARVYMAVGSKKLHAKSTGTTDAKLAAKLAEDFWADCLIKSKIVDGTVPSRSDLPTNVSLRFDRVADEYIDRLEKRAGSDKRRQRNLTDAKWAILSSRNGLAAFFKKSDIGSITTDRIHDYLAFQIDNSVKGTLAPATQKRALSVLSQILKFAFEKRYISNIPLMPKVKLVDNPRPWFDLKEYQKLHVTARWNGRRALKQGDIEAANRWLEQADYIVFMVNSFLRPSEWYDIKQKHVRIVPNAKPTYDPHLELTIIAGKTGQRIVTTMPRAAAAYKRIIERTGKDPEKFVFLDQYPIRQTAQERMRDRFEALLQQTGLVFNSFGQKRTLYSLRHSALMLRLLHGDDINLLLLAKNAGTSIDQFERFYLSHLKTDQMLENLHSFKTTKRY